MHGQINQNILSMSDYVKVFKTDDIIEVCFYIEHNNILAIGEKMNEINDNAYMNGYNWEAFFKYYLDKKEPNLLEELEQDPEAGTYVGYYKMSKENESKANRFADIIKDLVENTEKIYNFLRENGDKIEWD